MTQAVTKTQEVKEALAEFNHWYDIFQMRAMDPNREQSRVDAAWDKLSEARTKVEQAMESAKSETRQAMEAIDR